MSLVLPTLYDVPKLGILRLYMLKVERKYPMSDHIRVHPYKARLMLEHVRIHHYKASFDASLDKNPSHQSIRIFSCSMRS